VVLMLTELSQVSEVGPREAEQQATLHLSWELTLLYAARSGASTITFLARAL